MLILILFVAVIVIANFSGFRRLIKSGSHEAGGKTFTCPETAAAIGGSITEEREFRLKNPGKYKTAYNDETVFPNVSLTEDRKMSNLKKADS